MSESVYQIKQWMSSSYILVSLKSSSMDLSSPNEYSTELFFPQVILLSLSKQSSYLCLAVDPRPPQAGEESGLLLKPVFCVRSFVGAC